MIRPKFILLFFLILTLPIQAQDAITYYEKINEGKLFASEGDYQSAVNSYRSALNDFDIPFARDCYNAIELAVAANDSANLFDFITIAISRGITTAELEQSSILRDYIKSQSYEEIKLKEDSLKDVYHSSVNWVIREEINDMFAEDQRLREKYYSSNILQRRKIGKEWEKLNAAQVEHLIRITETHGFPGERLIGLDKEEMHPAISSFNFSAGMPIVILIHHFSQPNSSHDKLLFEEVKKGNLYNEHFATICDFEAEFGKGKFECFGYFGLRHYPSQPDENSINIRRQKIGLLSVEQMKTLNRNLVATKFWKRLY